LDNDEDIQEIQITKLKRIQIFSNVTWSASFSGKSEGTTDYYIPRYYIPKTRDSFSGTCKGKDKKAAFTL
jgi:hypothetical protein